MPGPHKAMVVKTSVELEAVDAEHLADVLLWRAKRLKKFAVKLKMDQGETQ